MALIDYSALVLTIRDLIGETGRAITFQKLENSLDLNKPWKKSDPVILTEVTSFGTFVPLSGNSDLGLNFIEDELLKRSDSVCLVAPHDSFDLSDFNKILDGANSWKIEGVST